MLMECFLRNFHYLYSIFDCHRNEIFWSIFIKLMRNIASKGELGLFEDMSSPHKMKIYHLDQKICT